MGGICPPFAVVRSLEAGELAGSLLDQAVGIFAAALGFPRRHARVRSFAATLRRHATYGGFRAFGGFTLRQHLVGFSYGYSSQPGLWWRDEITGWLSPRQRDYWLADAFEFAELHVHPSAQGKHLGGELHDRLIASQSHATALLSVMHRSLRARQLYASRGWEILVDEMRFSTEPNTAFSVLGLRRTVST